MLAPAGGGQLVLRVGGKTAVNFHGGFTCSKRFLQQAGVPVLSAGAYPAVISEVFLW